MPTIRFHMGTHLSRWGLAAAVLILSALAGPTASAQSTPLTSGGAVQTLAFEEGANLVSLHVIPDDTDLRGLFGDHLDEIVLIKDAKGTVFAPSYGIDNLSDWAWGEALLVQTRSPFTLEVVGDALSPESTIELQPGWNWIPFLMTDVTPVEVALASISDAIERIEDASGRAYPAVEGDVALSTLAPGQGYKVRLSEARTLEYGTPPSPEPPSPEPPSPEPPSPETPPTTTEVATVLDAIAITGLEPGQQIAIRGFRKEGDGGAGVLRVTDSGCVPDGGTCFVPTEHTEAGEPYAARSDVNLYGSAVQWETFQICHSEKGEPADPSAASGDGCYDALQLHGHGARNEGHKTFDPATGQVDVSPSMRGFAKRYDGDDDSEHTITFRFATSDLRLERVVDPVTLEGSLTTAYVRPEWWGGQPEAGDATDAVSWALESAETKAAESGTEHYVVLSGMYSYAGVIETQEGTVLKGERDGVRDGQGLRVLEGSVWHYWAVQDQTDPDYQEPHAERDGLSDPFVVVRHGRLSMRDRVVDVEIDGNLAENDYVFDADYRVASGSSTYEGYSVVDELLQNTAHWNGFVASHQSRDLLHGSNTMLQNVHVHDFGGNVLLSNDACHFGGSRDLRLGNTVRNHTMYGIPTGEGTFIDGIEIYGFSWKVPVEQYQGHYKDVVFRDIVRNPYRHIGTEVLGYLRQRNDAPNAVDFYTDNETKHFFGEDVLIEGVVFDLRDVADNALPEGDLIGYARGPMTVRDVTVLLGAPGDTDRTVPLVNPRTINATPTSTFELDGARIVGGGVSKISTAFARSTIVRDLQFADGAGDEGWGGLYQVRTQAPDGFFVFEASGRQRARRPLEIRMDKAGAGADVFVSGGEFFDVDYPLHTRDRPGDAADRYRVFWKDVSLDRWRFGADLHKEISYLQNVTNSATGRTSEAEGSLSNARLSSGSIDVAADLLWEPLDASYVTVSGPDAGRFTGWTNVGTEDEPVLRLSFSGTGRVTVDWSAAVRPFPADVASLE